MLGSFSLGRGSEQGGKVGSGLGTGSGVETGAEAGVQGIESPIMGAISFCNNPTIYSTCCTWDVSGAKPSTICNTISQPMGNRNPYRGASLDAPASCTSESTSIPSSCPTKRAYYSLATPSSVVADLIPAFIVAMANGH